MPSDRDRVAADPALLAAARARYTGSGDVLDQLWWIDHPGEAAPSGAPDPGTRLERDRAALYRPGGGAQDAERVGALERRIAADRTAAEAAVRDATAAVRTAPPRDRGAPRRRGEQVLWAVAVLVVAVVAAGYAGLRIGRSQAAPPDRVSALDVFDRAAQDGDRPPGSALEEFLRGAAVRRLHAYSSIGLVAYAVRTSDGDVCLLSTVLGEEPTAACTTRAAFTVGGVSWVGVASADPVDDSGRRPIDEIRLTWNTDGTISITPVDTSR